MDLWRADGIDGQRLSYFEMELRQYGNTKLFLNFLFSFSCNQNFTGISFSPYPIPFNHELQDCSTQTAGNMKFSLRPIQAGTYQRSLVAFHLFYIDPKRLAPFLTLVSQGKLIR